MLPPIPHGLVPVTSQHDVVKPQPSVAPVSPVQASAKGSAVSLDRDEMAAAQEQARQEQRRKQQQPYAAQQDEEADGQDASGQPKADEDRLLMRKGLWVDISV